MALWHGALCPLRSRVEWHDSEQRSLPPMLACSSTGELEDLHNLRRHVAQLKLEIHIHQVRTNVSYTAKSRTTAVYTH